MTRSSAPRRPRLSPNLPAILDSGTQRNDTPALGLVFEKQGRKPEALAEINTALRLKPDYENAKKALKRLKG